MRIVVRRLLTLGAVITAVLLGAAHASAEFVACPLCNGDPTSMLISNPATESATTLYANEADYQALVEALEPGEPAALRSGYPQSRPINITWQAHDVAMWIDFVRLGSDGQLWIQSNSGPKAGSLSLGDRGVVMLDKPTWVLSNLAPNNGSGGVSWGDGSWYPAADPAAARDVLERAGVLSTDSSTKAKAAAESEVDKEVAPVAADSQDKSVDVLTGWWWLFPGAAVGIALGLGARPLATELARRREPGPRHQLIG
jgi:hypothetical protein